MPRGGPRPGAGAPINNTNALRHGLRSPRALVLTLLASPDSRLLLLSLLRRQSKNQALLEAKILPFFLNNQTPVQPHRSLPPVLK